MHDHKTWGVGMVIGAAGRQERAALLMAINTICEMELCDDWGKVVATVLDDTGGKGMYWNFLAELPDEVESETYQYLKHLDALDRSRQRSNPL